MKKMIMMALIAIAAVCAPATANAQTVKDNAPKKAIKATKIQAGATATCCRTACSGCKCQDCNNCKQGKCAEGCQCAKANGTCQKANGTCPKADKACPTAAANCQKAGANCQKAANCKQACPKAAAATAKR